MVVVVVVVVVVVTMMTIMFVCLRDVRTLFQIEFNLTLTSATFSLCVCVHVSAEFYCVVVR